MKTAVVLLSMVVFTVAANLLLKTGASASVNQGLTQLLNFRILLGLMSYGLAACCYILILRWLPLNIATSFAAAQYVAVILAAAFILAEPIKPVQWLGIVLITSGIAVLGWGRQ